MASCLHVGRRCRSLLLSQGRRHRYSTCVNKVACQTVNPPYINATDARRAQDLQGLCSRPCTRFAHFTIQRLRLRSVRVPIGVTSKPARVLVYLAARVQGFLDHPDVRLQGRGVHGLEAVPVRQQLARREEGPAGKEKRGQLARATNEVDAKRARDKASKRKGEREKGQ